ncbi:MAG: hypothetical protein JRF33_05435 [Deltaproteobacteria bacterium]|nr:hypothetical protein [Deltaproteobacteria bacterium]
MATTLAQRKPLTDDDLRTYIRTLKQDPKSRVFAPLAEGLLARGRVTQALQVSNMGVRANPDFADGHIVMTMVLLAQKNTSRAAQFIQRALELAPERAIAHAMASQVQMAQGQNDAAYTACLKALDLDPDCAPALDLLGQMGQRPKGTRPRGKKMPASKGTSPDLKRRAQTAPSRRRRNGGPVQHISEPFRKILPALGQEATERLEDQLQPFTALSSGSQAGAGPDADTDNLLSQVPQSSLPDHPPPQAARPATPAHADPAIAPTSGLTGPGLKTVTVAQAIIDSYGPAQAYESSRRSPSLTPWAGRLLALASIIALLLGIVALLAALRPDKGPVPTNVVQKAQETPQIEKEKEAQIKGESDVR